MKFRRIVNLICVAFLCLWVTPKLFMVQVRPWEIGVRRSLFSGIAEEDFGLGYHLSVPLVHSYYRLPKTLQFLDYNSDDPNAESGSLEVRTSGNNVIFVDVTIPWRIEDGSAWKIIREGFLDTYPERVESTAAGVLREGLAEMSNLDIYNSGKRQARALGILPKLNTALAQYHVTAEHVVIRAIRFRPEYEQKLQDKQFYVVQGRLDEALRQESVAVQATQTFEKRIDLEIALKREEWNKKIEELKTVNELEIAGVDAGAVQYDRKRRAEGDAFYSEAKAEGDLAESKANALGEKLKADALATQAGRTFSAITAAENFEIGSIQLNSNDPAFLQNFGSMKAWRKFFLGD